MERRRPRKTTGIVRRQGNNTTTKGKEMDSLKENVYDEEFDLKDEGGWPFLQATGLL